VELELDLIDWSLVSAALDIDEDEENFFAWNILKLPPGDMKRMFPALQVLSLSAVSFTSAAKEIANAFDFSSLRSLKLRFCPGWEDFLQQVSHSNQPIRLKSLEVQSSISDETDHAPDTISGFLGIFEGLEELFIYTHGPSPETIDIWHSALRHKATLRRFSHHQRSINLDEDPPVFEKEYDLSDLSFVSWRIAELIKDPLRNPFSDLDLECIGLCCIPKLLV
jgi:hypothetical protein